MKRTCTLFVKQPDKARSLRAFQNDLRWVITNNWATSWENLFMQYANNKGADQPAHPPLLFTAWYNTSSFDIQNFKPLASLCSLAGRFESYRLKNPEDRFSRNDAKLSFSLFDFYFYCYSIHFRIFRARSVNLATLFLSKPPRQFYQYLVHILSPVTDNCSSWISGRGRMAVEIFSWPSLHERMCRTWGSNSGPLACQANILPIELPRPVIIIVFCHVYLTAKEARKSVTFKLFE